MHTEEDPVKLLVVEQLIRDAQAGDEQAKNDLIRFMMNDKCMARLNRYLYMNRLMEPDEVRGEFWLGIAQSIHKVKPNVGNPLQFLVQCGIWRVVVVMRHRLQKHIAFGCVDCGKHGRLTRRVMMAGCSRCASVNINTYNRYELVDEWSGSEREVARFNSDLDQFKTRLTYRELQILDALLSGYDREGCTNYLVEIGKQLGVTSVCIAIHMRKIREKFRAFLSDND